MKRSHSPKKPKSLADTVVHVVAVIASSQVMGPQTFVQGHLEISMRGWRQSQAISGLRGPVIRQVSMTLPLP